MIGLEIDTKKLPETMRIIKQAQIICINSVCEHYYSVTLKI